MHTGKTLAWVGAVLALASLASLQVLAQRGGVRHVTPEELRYRPFPEERGAQIALLHGNPAEAGHYIVRLKFAANWDGRPHLHGGAELLLVRSGVWYVAYGEELTREAALELPAGSFMAIPAGTKMRAFTGAAGAEVDIQGQGPFTTRYLDE